MKRLLLACCLLMIVETGLSQRPQESAFQLTKLSPKDTLLSGWKFMTGDKPAWMKKGYDDSHWQLLDPGMDITSFAALKKAGKGWLRLHIATDSSTFKKGLCAWVFQYTASEIYLDGRLIKNYGIIGDKPSATKAFCPSGDFFELPLQPGAAHVLAVRLGYEQNLPYASPYFTPLTGFSMYINTSYAALSNYQQANYLTSKALMLCGAFAGMTLIISAIYLFYFLFDRKQKVHLYYSISSGFFFVLFMAFTAFINNIQSVSSQMVTAFIIAIGFVCSSLFMLLTVYTLFNYEKRMVFKILVVGGFAALVYVLFSDIAGFIVATNGFMGICILEGTRASALAVRKNKNGAAVILCGLVVATFLNIWSASIEQNSFFGMTLACLAILAFPLGMSVYLAIQNASTNQTLRSSLAEVQSLSAQNLQKEQEKQQILAGQNELLEQQVSERTAALNQSLNDLKSAQKQLIQSEKMASLGELTAGIAHEIQNPLNFVNNFSDVTNELIDEMNDELNRGDIGEVKIIAGNIKQNLEKINHHGKRADAIVKGMMQHSQRSSGAKELTDINALAEEYLRLAYHGLRAKDNSFNAAVNTDFNDCIGKINIIPQDIGRVMLNLITNAFHATAEKKKGEGAGYEPTVSIATTKMGNDVQISVADNGAGIPQKFLDKIFQPFFTTRPTGQGTGLGLSLAYDIIKAHGGEIKVVTKEGEGTGFTVQLPIT